MSTGTFDIGGQGGNAFPFDRIGDSVTGKVIDLAEVQSTDMATGELAFWPNGQPKMMYRVTLATDLRTPGDHADDGTRSVYLRGSRKSGSKSSLSAVLDAVRAATGATQLAAGGSLTLTFVGEGMPTQRGWNPPKQYEARYVPPAMNLGGDEPPSAQPAVPSTVQQFMTAPPDPEDYPAGGTPAAQAFTPEQIAAIKAAGVDPATLGQAS